ncbi:MAG: DUF3109 family protein [Bacteroidetes bacterium]|nr:DUF3109 family protein [Bacteroidota bacterium]
MHSNTYTLTRHTLAHVQQLSVDPELFTLRFLPQCSMCNCNGMCCREGVYVDLEEKSRILDHSSLILQYMEPNQVREPSQWFDENVQPDPDFPSGFCDGTQVANGGCVFLNSKGLCTLQITAMQEGMSKYALKPFYCFAFPLTLDGGVLTMYEPEFANRPECCSAVPDGTLTILDICWEELEFMLGREGADEFRALFETVCTNKVGK